MNYPYYIVTWQEGRTPCPAHLRGTSLKREYDRGRIGGKKNVAKIVQSVTEAFTMLQQDRFNRTVYVVPQRNHYRQRLRYEQVAKLAREED